MKARRVRHETTICGVTGGVVSRTSRMSMCVRNGQHKASAATRPRENVGRGGAVQRPNGELAVWLRHDGDALIVVIAGDFDLATAGPVQDALSRAMSEARRVIVDLGAVRFIDSSGLHTIVDAYKRCRDGVPRLTIRPGPPNVQQVFELTNLLDRLPFESTGSDSTARS